MERPPAGGPGVPTTRRRRGSYPGWSGQAKTYEAKRQAQPTQHIPRRWSPFVPPGL